MGQNTEIVQDFIRCWSDFEIEKIMSFFTDDCVYHNIPMEKMEGRAAAAAFITGMQPESVHWEILSIAENNDKVLTERIDNFVLPGGKNLSIPVMGTFEIENGEIKAWRDYFDLTTFTSQMA